MTMTSHKQSDRFSKFRQTEAVPLVLDHNETLHVRHKRGTDYEVVGQASLQSGSAIAEGAHLVIYRDSRGLLWARPSAEFLDGRLVKLVADDGFNPHGSGPVPSKRGRAER